MLALFDERQAALDKLVDDLQLSVRTANLLQNLKVKRVRDLVLLSEKDLLKQPHHGRKTLNEVKDTLYEMGLELGMSQKALEEIDSVANGEWEVMVVENMTITTKVTSGDMKSETTTTIGKVTCRRPKGN